MRNRLKYLLKSKLTKTERVMRFITNWTIYSPLADSIRFHFKRIARIVRWGFRLRDSYDYDSAFLIEIMVMKMEDIYKCMLSGNGLIGTNPNSNRMKKFAEAIQLGKRIVEDNYYVTAYYKCVDKYGLSHDIISNDKYSTIKRTWNCPEERGNLYYKAQMNLCKKQKKAEQDRFFYLVHKYYEMWWD